ncbi:MAG: hypothetical protein HGB34_00750 [Candidatus Moranbacteria bacterium]|nr:hypothetical protein [Candidatus Moranbacteria bacterium]
MPICSREVRPDGVIIAVDQYPFLKILNRVFSAGTVSENHSVPTYIVSSGNPEETAKEMAHRLAMGISERHADRVVIAAATLALRVAESAGTVLTDPDGKDDLVSLLEDEETFRLLMAVAIIIPGCDPSVSVFTEEMILKDPDVDLDSIPEESYGSSSPRSPFSGYFRKFILDIEEDEWCLSERIRHVVVEYVRTHDASHLLRAGVSAMG